MFSESKYILLQLNIITDVLTYQSELMEKKQHMSYKKFLKLMEGFNFREPDLFDRYLNSGELIVLNLDGSWEIPEIKKQDHTFEELALLNGGNTDLTKKENNLKNPLQVKARILKNRINELRKQSKGFLNGRKTPA